MYAKTSVYKSIVHHSDAGSRPVWVSSHMFRKDRARYRNIRSDTFTKCTQVYGVLSLVIRHKVKITHESFDMKGPVATNLIV